MAYLLALFLPFAAVMAKGRMGLGVGLLLLQITVLGWIPATIVAFMVINEQNQKATIKKYATK